MKRGYKPFIPSYPSLYLNRDEFLASQYREYSSKSIEIDDDLDRYGKLPMDPLFKEQWYLRNTGQNGGKPKLDLNVRAAWAQGVSGKNVTTAIMDDGEKMSKYLNQIYLKKKNILNINASSTY